MTESEIRWHEISDAAALAKLPDVSVHMITYNQERFLADAIEGVLRQQTSFSYEIVLGEDCSTDGTRNIALHYQRRHPDRIRVLVPERNVGAVRNFLAQIGQCRGRYIAFCEGDDYWHDSTKLEQQVSFLERHADHVMVHSDFDVKWGDEVEAAYYKRVQQKVPAGAVFEQMLVTCFVKTLTVCLRSEIAKSFLESPFGKGQYPFCDYPLWLYAASQGLVGFLAESLATYRVTAGSMTHSDCQTAVRFQLALCQVVEDFLRAFPDQVKNHAEILLVNGLKRLRALSLSTDREGFLSEFGRFRKLHPGWRPDVRMRFRYLLIRMRLGVLLREYFNLLLWRKHRRVREL